MHGLSEIQLHRYSEVSDGSVSSLKKAKRVCLEFIFPEFCSFTAVKFGFHFLFPLSNSFYLNAKYSLLSCFPMAGSMLHAMFSGRFDTKPSEDGSYFIDRDGTHFRYLLNYLRTGQLTVPDDKILRRELLAEAEFYQVEGMIRELTARPFRDSVILSSDQRETMMNWLKGTQALNNTRGNLFFGLIYRASRDGWTAADFHSRCDYKGPSVTVITSGKSIFGGYTDQQWRHSGKHFKQAWS